MSKPITEMQDPRLGRALAHPIRVRILAILEQRIASPKQMALEIGVPIENIAYHVRRLRELEIIKLASTKQRRGALEHFYKTVGRPTITAEAWEKLPLVVREAIDSATISQIFDIVAAASAQGKLDHPESQIRRLSYELDEQGFSEMSEVMTEMVERFLDVEGRAAGRLQKRHEGEYRTVYIGMLFGAPKLDMHLDESAPPSALTSRRRGSYQRAT